MDGPWILLVIIAIAMSALVVLVLCRMAGEQDRRARHAEREICPHSDVTITRTGGG
jgi:hypothetical protein